MNKKNDKTKNYNKFSKKVDYSEYIDTDNNNEINDDENQKNILIESTEIPNDYIDTDDYQNNNEEDNYIYDINSEAEIYNFKKYDDREYGPFTDSWVHDNNQKNDIITDIELERQKIVDYLMSIEYPPQRSEGWFKQRDTIISASDGGSVVGSNKHEQPYKFIIKKVFGSTFKSNEFCYHGKKYETPATMIYENRMNVKVYEFGLVKSKKYKFLGASPDGIIGKYKKDGKSLTNKVGRMLEIKCPFIRKIKHDGEIIDHQVPIYYWVQVQLQLQCCELDECDFWQCKIYEYDDREEFLNDTSQNEPWRSRHNNLEKSCLIQLIPKNSVIPDFDINNKEHKEKYFNNIYENAIFIYPDELELGPKKLKEWENKTIEDIKTNEKYKDYIYDRTIFWRLDNSSSVTIQKDNKWFNDNIELLEKMWSYVEFYRNIQNIDKRNELFNFVNSDKLKTNKKVMKLIDYHFNNIPTDSLLKLKSKKKKKKINYIDCTDI